MWADYLISAVRYNSKRTHIDMVRCHKGEDKPIDAGQDISRETVVSEIEARKSFVTIVKGSDGKYRRGEDVRIIVVTGVKYIRTDANSLGADNLGNLAEF
jgi:hypothetical protein